MLDSATFVPPEGWGAGTCLWDFGAGTDDAWLLLLGAASPAVCCATLGPVTSEFSACDWSPPNQNWRSFTITKANAPSRSASASHSLRRCLVSKIARVQELPVVGFGLCSGIIGLCHRGFRAAKHLQLAALHLPQQWHLRSMRNTRGLLPK